MIKYVLAIFTICFVASFIDAQHNGQISSSGYVYHAQSGYWTFGGNYYTRSLYQSPGYWSCGVYYPGSSYYTYQQVNYYPPQTYTPPVQQPFDVDQAILKIKADQQKTIDFIAKLKAAGLSVNDLPPGSIPPQYLQGGYNGYSLAGHYYNYQVPVTASTLYGYNLKDIAALYGSTDLNQLYLQAQQLAQGSQRLTSEATQGFQQLVGQAGENAAKIAEIQTKGQVAAALIKAMEGTPSAQYKGYSFRVSPGGVVEKMENNVDPNTKKDLQNQLAALVGQFCAQCHTGKAPKGGFDISTYLDLNTQQKQAVWARLTTDDPQKLMPRNVDGTPGKKLTPDQLKLFFLN